MQPRADAMAELETLRHELLCSEQMGDWLAQASLDLERGDIAQSQRVHIAEMQRHWQQAKALPADLVHAKVLAGTRCLYHCGGAITRGGAMPPGATSR